MRNTAATASIIRPTLLRDPLQLLSNRPLRTQLILAFLVVVTLSVGGVAFFANQAIQTALSEQVGKNLHSQAEVRALVIVNWLDQQVNQLHTFGLNEAVLSGAEKASSAYRGDPAAIRNDIEQHDKQWSTAEDSSALVQQRLNNPIAEELGEYVKAFPHNIETFVTDKYGALVAASARTPKYDYSKPTLVVNRRSQH